MNVVKENAVGSCCLQNVWPELYSGYSEGLSQ